MNCPSCGAKNPDGARWCGQCHQSFERPTTPPEGPAPAASAPQPNTDGTPVTSPAGAVTKPASGFAVPETAVSGSAAIAAPAGAGATNHVVTQQSSGFAVPMPAGGSGVVPETEPSGPVLDSGGVPLGAPVVAPEPPANSHAAVPATFSPSATQMPALPGPVVSESRRAPEYGGVTTANKAGIIKDGAGRLLWQCSACGATNDIDALECSVCGSSMFAEYIKEAEAAGKPAATPAQAAAWGAIPGGGQWAAGHKGDAIGRGLLVFWLIICAVLLNDKSIMWVRAIFALAAIATWVVSALDARIQAGAKGIEILTVKRLLLVLVLSVALLLALSFVLAGKVRELDQKNPRGPLPQTQVPPGGGNGNGDNGQGGDGAPT